MGYIDCGGLDSPFEGFVTPFGGFISPFGGFVRPYSRQWRVRNAGSPM